MSKYETLAGKVSLADTYNKLYDLLRQAQDQAAMLGHLYKAQDEELRGQGFLAVSELLGRMAHQTNRLAQGKTTNLILPN